MFQDLSSEHVLELKWEFENPQWPFKSEIVSNELLRVLSGLCQFPVQHAGQWIAYLWYQPYTTTANSLQESRPLAGHFKNGSELIQESAEVDMLATPTGAYRDHEPGKRCEHER